MNYDANNERGKSKKGPIMKIGNTFIRCFAFTIRRLLLVFLVIYVFTCFFQSALYWVPCTLFGDYQGTDDDLMKWFTPWYEKGCERNNVDAGFLNVTLVFRNFAVTFTVFLWAFFSRDPQEIFAYVIQKADDDKHSEVANKRLIFLLFYTFYIFIIVFAYNFLTAEIMQLCDVLRFNLLHQTEIEYLKPSGRGEEVNYFYSIEWKLNINSQRCAMIIEYYTQRLAEAIIDNDSDEDNLSEDDHAPRGSVMNDGGGGGGGGDDDDDDDDEHNNNNDESEIELSAVNGGKPAKASEINDKARADLKMSNPLRDSTRMMTHREKSMRRKSTKKAANAKRQSALHRLPIFVKKRELPSGEVMVDPRMFVGSGSANDGSRDNIWVSRLDGAKDRDARSKQL